MGKIVRKISTQGKFDAFLAAALHAQQAGAPGKSAAHSFKQHNITLFDTPISYGLAERQRDGRRRRITMMINGDDNLGWIDFQLVG
jgi:hypothetical protein